METADQSIYGYILGLSVNQTVGLAHFEAMIAGPRGECRSSSSVVYRVHRVRSETTLSAE